MKKLVKPLTALFLASSYCLALGVASFSHSITAFQGDVAAERGGYFTAISVNLPGLASQIKTAANHFGEASAFDHSSAASGAAIQAADYLAEGAFIHYAALAQFILVRYRKSDLIFPFHYFW